MNPGPPGYEPGALTTELKALKWVLFDEEAPNLLTYLFACLDVVLTILHNHPSIVPEFDALEADDLSPLGDFLVKHHYVGLFSHVDLTECFAI